MEEIIQRESELIIDSLTRSPEECGFLSWGNLLLEEAIYRRARGLGIPTFFYLVNPSYLGKPSASLKIADVIFSDSEATRRPYQDHATAPIKLLSKIFSACTSNQSPEERRSKKQSVLSIRA